MLDAIKSGKGSQVEQALLRYECSVEQKSKISKALKGWCC